MIETIFLCLPDAIKGTIYRVGKAPDLVVERVTSGVISDDKNGISWGLPSKSEYNFPGKPWMDYRDEPGRPLEAMGWCVERQKSWTAEDPANDFKPSPSGAKKQAIKACFFIIKRNFINVFQE